MDVQDLAAVERDLADLGRPGWFGIYSSSTHGWLWPESGLATTCDTDAFADDGLVAVVPGWGRGFVETNDLAKASAVDLTDFLQDAVVDDAGFGWPELCRDGVFLGLLTPVDLDGRPWWALAGDPIVRVGELVDLGRDAVKRAL